MMPATFRHSLVRIAAGLLCCSAVLSAQVTPDCERARHDEEERHRDAEAEISKRQVDISNEYNKKLIGCRNSDSCRSAAREERDQKQIRISQDASDENATNTKNVIDISRGRCNTRATSAPSTNNAPPDRESPILASGDQQRLFKLGAEMNTIAEELAPEAQGNAGAEFLKGLADWANQTLGTLAQKPGVPMQQMAQGIVDYLTNDNAANHQALLRAATQAVNDFEKNPARFIGQNLPNALPGPGVLGKIPALRQIANVEKAAESIKALSATRKAFQSTMKGMLEEDRQWGSAMGKSPCFANNACFATAQAEAELFRAGGAAGDVPVRVNGVYGKLPGQDIRMSNAQISDRLRNTGRNFTPRRADTFTEDQLKDIAQGVPIRVASPGQITNILDREGVGSQGLVFAKYRPSPTHAAGSPLGHVMNAQKPGMAPAHIVDQTTPGFVGLSQGTVTELWFFPMH